MAHHFTPFHILLTLFKGLIDPLALVGARNSRMDGRSATACLLVMLVLFGSTASGGMFSVLLFM